MVIVDEAPRLGDCMQWGIIRFFGVVCGHSLAQRECDWTTVAVFSHEPVAFPSCTQNSKSKNSRQLWFLNAAHGLDQ